jgi:hypothetical protein
VSPAESTLSKALIEFHSGAVKLNLLVVLLLQNNW